MDLVKMSVNDVDCPRCGGGMAVTDWSRCGPSCRLDSPPEIRCGFCGGLGYVDVEDAEDYDSTRNYEQEAKDAADEAHGEALFEARRMGEYGGY